MPVFFAQKKPGRINPANFMNSCKPLAMILLIYTNSIKIKKAIKPGWKPQNKQRAKQL